MAAIGAVSFVSGSMPVVLPAMPSLETIDRSGVDGHEFRQKGKRAPPVIWTTEADVASATTDIPVYRALSGTLQTITNVDGSTVQAVAVELLDVQEKFVLVPSGGLVGGAWWLVAQWRLQAGV